MEEEGDEGQRVSERCKMRKGMRSSQDTVKEWEGETEEERVTKKSYEKKD